MEYNVIESDILKGGGVERITVSAGGSGYVQASTTVEITGGGGTGATATATLVCKIVARWTFGTRAIPMDRLEVVKA